MFSYLLKKIVLSLSVLLGIVTVVFVLLNMIPVNQGRQTLGQSADAATLEAVEQQLRLSYSAPYRFWFYLSDLSPLSIQSDIDEDAPLYLEPSNYSYLTLCSVFGKKFVVKWPYLGRSFQSQKKVSAIIQKRLFPTAILAITSISIASVLGIFLGIVSALNHRKWIDQWILSFSVLGISVPSYFSAIVLAILFGFYWSGWTGLNVSGPLINVSDYGMYYIDWPNLILPALALGIRPVAIIVQLTRSSMIEVLSMDYIRTAKAKGLSRRTVIYKHALRNALNPVVTSITGWFAALFAGAVFVEKVFGFKGIGDELVTALLHYDFPVVMGIVLFVAFVFMVISVLVDMLYSWLDPRIVLNE